MAVPAAAAAAAVVSAADSLGVSGDDGEEDQDLYYSSGPDKDDEQAIQEFCAQMREIQDKNTDIAVRRTALRADRKAAEENLKAWLKTTKQTCIQLPLMPGQEKPKYLRLTPKPFTHAISSEFITQALPNMNTEALVKTYQAARVAHDKAMVEWKRASKAAESGGRAPPAAPVFAEPTTFEVVAATLLALTKEAAKYRNEVLEISLSKQRPPKQAKKAPKRRKLNAEEAKEIKEEKGGAAADGPALPDFVKFDIKRYQEAGQQLSKLRSEQEVWNRKQEYLIRMGESREGEVKPTNRVAEFVERYHNENKKPETDEDFESMAGADDDNGRGGDEDDDGDEKSDEKDEDQEEETKKKRVHKSYPLTLDDGKGEQRKYFLVVTQRTEPGSTTFHAAEHLPTMKAALVGSVETDRQRAALEAPFKKEHAAQILTAETVSLIGEKFDLAKKKLIESRRKFYQVLTLNRAPVHTKPRAAPKKKDNGQPVQDAGV